jgi:LacI family transcriptional regulator
VTEPFALAVIESARALGRQVPEDLLVASTRDLRPGDLPRAELTTLEFHPHQLGAAAVDLLLRLIRHETRPAKRLTRIPATLEIRASTVVGRTDR